jgi:hypothetical protein
VASASTQLEPPPPESSLLGFPLPEHEPPRPPWQVGVADPHTGTPEHKPPPLDLSWKQPPPASHHAHVHDGEGRCSFVAVLEEGSPHDEKCIVLSNLQMEHLTLDVLEVCITIIVICNILLIVYTSSFHTKTTLIGLIFHLKQSIMC